ncbi:MAG TPA: PrsW family glutamic-type intramembrane protease [Thermomicrobiales bacterium]
MSGGNTTQFLFAPDVRPNNRKYLLMLTSGFWTLCLGCTLLSVLLDVLSGGIVGILASPFIIGAAMIPNVGIALAIPRLQRFQRSHRYVLIGAFLGGAIIAIPPALVINTTLFLPIELSMSSILELVGYGTIAGIVEEGIKGLILLFIYLRFRDEFHDPVDGVVLGALVGLGFAMTEDISYFFRGLDSGVVGLILTLFLRLVLGWMNHSVFTAITGLALGFARMGPPGPRRWSIPLAGYAVAAGLHNTFNFSATLLERIVPDNLLGLLLTIVPLYGLTWTAMAILGFMVVRNWHHEADIVRAELRDEVAGGIVTVREYQALPNPGQRRIMLREAQAQGGKGARSLLGKIFQLQIALALQKRHAAFGDQAAVPSLHSEPALRDRIANARASFGGVPPLVTAGPAGFAPPPPPVFTGGPSPVPPSSPTVQLSPADPFARADQRPYRLIVTNGSAPGTTVLLRDGLTIGRQSGRAEFVLNDPEVSSLHARIARNGGPPILIDADSMNGTFVNEERVTSRALVPGDRVRLGRVQLIVEAAG